MKKVFTFALLALTMTVIPSCQPDETDNTTPTDDRDKFVASWTCNEVSSQTQSSSFTVHINKSTTSSTQVQIEDFYHMGFQNKANADISGSSITIPQQLYNGNQIHGSGSMGSNTNQFTMTYYVDQGSGSIDTCTATFIRQ